jgi:hypothetical protein
MGLHVSLILSLLLAAPVCMSAQDTPLKSTTKPNWEQSLEQRRAALIQQNGPGTDTPLRDQLLRMRETDQEARGFHRGEAPKTAKASAPNLTETDAALTEQLKQVVAAKGWPTIALVGIEASNAAMLVLTHTADHDWQRSLLPQLETLADANKIDGSALALVIDKELVASGKLQRYGSQFKFVNGQMAMYAVEDPAGLDRRRAQVLLPPMAAYEETLAAMYHLKVSKQIVSSGGQE